MGVERERLEAALKGAGVPVEEVVRYEELGGGTFNTVFGVLRADGTELVVKLAPEADVPVLRYESGLLGTEARFYELVRGALDVPVPAVLPAGTDGQLVMTRCAGENWFAVADRLDAGQRRGLRADLGRYVARLHTITGPGFGYLAEPWGPLRPTWRAAFTEMVEAVLADADRYGVTLPVPASRIRELLGVRGEVLDEVTSPRLVHFDLWDGNILVDGINGINGIDTDHPRVSGLIDAERAFWGDPLADFVSLALFGDIERDDAFLDGYRAAGGSVVFDAAERRRLGLYTAYLYLIMWVEAVPRASGAERVSWLRRMVLEPLAAMLAGWESDDVIV